MQPQLLEQCPLRRQLVPGRVQHGRQIALLLGPMLAAVYLVVVLQRRR